MTAAKMQTASKDGDETKDSQSGERVEEDDLDEKGKGECIPNRIINQAPIFKFFLGKTACFATRIQW